MYVALMNVYYGIKAYIDMFARKYPRHLLSSEILAEWTVKHKSTAFDEQFNLYMLNNSYITHF